MNTMYKADGNLIERYSKTDDYGYCLYILDACYAMLYPVSHVSGNLSTIFTTDGSRYFPCCMVCNFSAQIAAQMMSKNSFNFIKYNHPWRNYGYTRSCQNQFRL